jgi:hypothetical protein
MAVVQRPILPKVYQRYKMQQGGESLTFSPYITLVSDADELVKSGIKQQGNTGTNTARTDTYTCPVGKKWYLLDLSVSRTNAGNNIVHIPAADAYQFDNSGSVTFYRFNMRGIVLDGNTSQNSVDVLLNTGTSGNLDSALYYVEEDLQ